GDAGLIISSARNTIRGFAINRFPGFGIQIDGKGNLVATNFIGTDTTGTVAFGNTSDGVEVLGSNNSIGGSSSGAGNVISGNGRNGIRIEDSKDNVILGNAIGADVSRSKALPNSLNGISLEDDASNNRIGLGNGVSPNSIAFNGTAGINVSGS